MDMIGLTRCDDADVDALAAESAAPPVGDDGSEVGDLALVKTEDDQTNSAAGHVVVGAGVVWMTAAVRPLPVRPRSRGARRSLRTFPVVTLHPRFPFNVRLTGKTFD